LFVCDKTTTPDCAVRRKRTDARRFDTFFSLLVDSSYNQNPALETFRGLGIRRVAILRMPDLFDGGSFPHWAGDMTMDLADQLGLELVEILTMVRYNVTDHTTAACRNCPPNNASTSQSMVLPGGETGNELAIRWQAAGVEAIIILMVNEASACWTVAQLWRGMQSVDWTPRAISFGGNPEECIRPFLANPVRDLDFTWTTKPWDSRLRGPTYKNYRTDVSFELLPAIPNTMDGPSCWQQAYDAKYGPASSSHHPMWQPVDNNFWAGMGWAILELAQKMVEAAQSSYVPDILLASKSMSYPSMWHGAQFDMYGRLARVNEVLLQRLPQISSSTDVVIPNAVRTLAVLAPYNIGRSPIDPMPTWRERDVVRWSYGSSSHTEQVMLGVTGAATCIIFGVSILLLYHRRHMAVRAADLRFSSMVVLGALVLLSSNWFNVRPTSDAFCQAPVWLISTGFTLLFANLFVKTYRLMRIYHDTSAHLRPYPLSHVVLLVIVCVAIELGINLTWQLVAPLRVHTSHNDPFRPALDIVHCSLGLEGGRIFLTLQICIKCACLGGGMMLSFAARHLPSAFNESRLIALCIYHTAVVLAIALPLSFFVPTIDSVVVRGVAVIVVIWHAHSFFFCHVSRSSTPSLQTNTKNHS
jgi:hypothetical protein